MHPVAEAQRLLSASQQGEGIDGNRNKAGEFEHKVISNVVAHLAVDQDIEMVKSDSPDRYKGGNKCKANDS